MTNTEIELAALRVKYGEAVEEAIRLAKASGVREIVEAFDGAEAYAYPVGGNRIAWGINAVGSGFNIWRGVRHSNRADEGEL